MPPRQRVRRAVHVPAATSRTVCSLVATCLLSCALVCSGRLLSLQSGKIHPITGLTSIPSTIKIGIQAVID